MLAQPRRRTGAPAVSRSAHGAHLPRRRPDRHRLPPSRRHRPRPGARGLRHVPGRTGRDACATACRWAWTRRRSTPSSSPTPTSTTAACCRCWSARGSAAGSCAPPRPRSSRGWCCSTRRGSRRSSPSGRRAASGATRSARRRDEARDERLFEEARRAGRRGRREPRRPGPRGAAARRRPRGGAGPRRPALHRGRRRARRCRCFAPIPYGAEHEVAQGVHVTLLDAGPHPGLVHRPDAADARPAAGATPIVVFSGDLGRPGTPILRDPTPVDEADIVAVRVAPTAGASTRPPTTSIEMLATVVRETAARKGVLLIPSFAIGRTQEIVWELHRLVEAGRIPQLPLYLDSPMAKSASDIYRAHPEAYDEETAALLRAHDAPLDYPGQHVVQNVAGVRADRADATAVRDRRVQRDAHRRAVRGPRGAAARRPVGDDPVRGLPGRGHARRAPDARRGDRADQRARDAGPGDDPVARRVLRPRRRAGAARLAGRLHPRPASRATRACRRTCTWSTATRPRSRRWRPRWRRWGCRWTCRPGTRPSRWTSSQPPLARRGADPLSRPPAPRLGCRVCAVGRAEAPLPVSWRPCRCCCSSSR